MAAVTAAVIGAGTALYSANQAKKQQKDAQKFAKEQMGQLDPFAEYRPEYAKRLNDLTAPTAEKIAGSETYKARLQAAERTMAAQGYTGSGNALVAAADAGATAYQQEFDNYVTQANLLGNLSGAMQGQSARASGYGTAAGAQSNTNDNYLSALGGVGNNLTNLASMFGNGGGGGTTNVSSGWGSFTPNTGGYQYTGTLGPSNGSSWNFGGG